MVELGAKLLEYAQERNLATLTSYTAYNIVDEPLPRPNQVLGDFVDVADVMAIIGKSKQRKSWFALQLAICLATGEDFLGWHVTRPMTVALFQLEVQDTHYKRRVQRVCNTMFSGAAGLQNNLKNLRIFSCRGKSLTPEQLHGEIQTMQPDVVICDPLYTLIDEENASDSMKAAVQVFASIAETDALAIYVHHDKKGRSGDMDLVDRGSGHGILSRAYDAACFLDPHKESSDHTVVQSMCRNYRVTEPFAVTWEDYVFQVADDVDPEPATSQSESNKRARGESVNALAAKAETLLPPGELWLSEATEYLVENMGIGSRRAGQVMQKLRDVDFGCYVDETHERGRVKLIPIDRVAEKLDLELFAS